MVEMEVLGVRVEVPSTSPILLLRERVGERKRTLPVFIGAPEATAIAIALEGVEARRPLTHDLLKTVLDELGARLVRVEVTALLDGIFYADLHLVSGGKDLVISSRPSDAVALAVRVGAPVYASEAVLAEAGVIEELEPADAEEVVEQFKEFIETVEPEDFAP